MWKSYRSRAAADAAVRQTFERISARFDAVLPVKSGDK
jgi:hypothetical protein